MSTKKFKLEAVRLMDKSDRRPSELAMQLGIRCNHVRYNGSPKIHEELIAEDETCRVNRVALLMKVFDIKSKMARKFVMATNSK